MPFLNRSHAARLLIEKLSAFKGWNPLVLGIPRGGVPMAGALSDALGGELDVVLAHKLGLPGNPEVAIGSVSELGTPYLLDCARLMGVSEEYIALETEAQLTRLRRRREAYTPLRPPVDPRGRIVIVVDDGIATGATFIAALGAVRPRKPASLIAAAAVASPGAMELIRREADKVVLLETPDDFSAVAEFFVDFSEVSDEEVASILQASAATKT